MRTVNLCGKFALRQSSTRMSKAGPQDTGTRDHFKSWTVADPDLTLIPDPNPALKRNISVKCRAEIDHLDWFSTRINILGADPRMNPFNNDFFNGRCDKVRNPKTLQFDRLPWNIGVLNYQVSPSRLWNKPQKIQLWPGRLQRMCRFRLWWKRPPPGKSTKTRTAS